MNIYFCYVIRRSSLDVGAKLAILGIGDLSTFFRPHDGKEEKELSSFTRQGKVFVPQDL